MKRNNTILILLAFSLLLISFFFVTQINGFEKNSRKCENVGGICMESPCEEIGMEVHIDGVCFNEKGKVYEDVLYCCTKRWE